MGAAQCASALPDWRSLGIQVSNQGEPPNLHKQATLVRKIGGWFDTRWGQRPKQYQDYDFNTFMSGLLNSVGYSFFFMKYRMSLPAKINVQQPISQSFG